MKAILTYHSIDDSESPISLSSDAFDDHLRWFASGKVRVLPLADFMRHPASGHDAVALTFDDGFLNVKGAVERLLDRGLPPTVFAVSRHIGRTNAWGGRTQEGIPTWPLLDWNDLEHLIARGASVEAHTCTHPSLSQLTVDALDAELEECRDQLQSRLGVTSTHLAYPYGDVNDLVATRAARVFRFGHTTEFRAMGDAEAATHLPRLDMYYFRAPGALEAWGSPAFSRRVAWIRWRRSLRSWLLPR